MSSYITVDVSTVLPAKRKQAEKKDFISAVHIIPILQFDEVSSCLVETLVIYEDIVISSKSNTFGIMRGLISDPFQCFSRDLCLF